MRMATVLVVYTTEERRSVVGKRTIHKEMFPVYGTMQCDSQLGRETWHIFADDEEVETEVRNRLRQQSKTYMLRISTHF
jgi:hypothetical protein